MVFLSLWCLLYSIISYFMSKYHKTFFLKDDKMSNNINFEIHNSLSNAVNIKIFSNEKYEITKLKQIQKQLLNTKLNNNKNNLYIEIIYSIFNIIFTIILFIVLIKQFIVNNLQIDDIFFILYTIRTISSYLLNIIKNIFTINETFYKIKIQKKYLIDDKIIADNNIKSIKFNIPTIHIQNIYFSYIDNKYIFENFSLNIPQYQKLGIIGPSGAGKSTLINLLLRFFDVDSGEILIDGYNIKNDITQKSLRENISYIPQDPVLFHRTIRENIIYGKLDATEEELIEATKMACCYDFIINLENGFNTIVGERGVKLSGGQRQRISIARAILKNSKILILDEATSALDSITEKEIQKALENLMKNKTVIAIAHRLSTLNIMDRIVVLDKGKIVEDGTKEQLLSKQDGLFKKMWDIQKDGMVGEAVE